MKTCARPCPAQEEVEYTPGKRLHRRAGIGGMSIQPGADHVGEVQALERRHWWQKVWTHNYAKSPSWGGSACHRRRCCIQRWLRTIACSTPSTPLQASCCVAISHEPAGISLLPHHLHRRRQAVRRSRIRLGRRFPRYARKLEPPVPGSISRSARRRRSLGIRARIATICFLGPAQ